MSTQNKKYLVTGEPNGKTYPVLLKLKEVNEKNGPFSAAFVIGGPPTSEVDLSGLYDVVKSDFSSTFPIYFLAGTTSKGLLENSLIEELAHRNIHFSRPFGIAKTPDGLKFAYVSGVEDCKVGTDCIQIKKSDLEYLEEQYLVSEENGVGEETIDMLFSWSWPAGVLSKNEGLPVSESLSPILYRLKPRYIFCPSHSNDFHFERAPYENVDPKTGDFLHATRFISLASCLNENQKKWIYALNIEPAKCASFLSLSKKPDNCTSNPFDLSLRKSSSLSTATSNMNYFFQVPNDAVIGSKRRNEQSSSFVPLKRPPPGYVCKKCRSAEHYYRDCPHQDSKYGVDKGTYVCHICHEPGHHIRDCPKKEERQWHKKEGSPTVAPEDCWFCLSNPAARKYLIVDIGEEVYLTLAKGPLTPEHALIIPIEHIPSNTETISEELSREMKQFMLRIQNTLASFNKVPIFFRLRHNPTHHYHIQMIPIEHGKLDQFLDFLKNYSAQLQYDFSLTSPESSCPSFEFLYFKDDEICILAHTFKQETFFPAQFGRQVLAAFLDVAEYSDWKKQVYSEADEKKFVADLKKKLCRGQ